MLSRFFLLLLFITNLFASDFNLANRLVKAYPDFLEKYENGFIIFKDGSKMIFDNKIKHKSYEEMLNNASLKEQLLTPYVKISDNKNYTLSENEDSGRARNEEFFKKIYGKNQKEIEKNLVKIEWLTSNDKKKYLYVTKINGVDKKLSLIKNELEKLPIEIKKYALNPNGSYNFRKISSTNRLSSHSFGIAIDLDTEFSNYWLWDKKNKKFKYKNSIPLEIVKIFEKHGFIWGGRWYHYDTMHFEYRPELLN